MSSKHFVDGHVLTLLRNGEEYFPCLITAIDQAKYSVYLETYIYAADASGAHISQALQRAAIRGVRVNLLLDGFGAAHLPRAWIDDMRRVGVRVLWFRPWVGWLSLRLLKLPMLKRNALEQALVGLSGQLCPKSRAHIGVSS